MTFAAPDSRSRCAPTTDRKANSDLSQMSWPIVWRPCRVALKRARGNLWSRDHDGESRNHLPPERRLTVRSRWKPRWLAGSASAFRASHRSAKTDRRNGTTSEPAWKAPFSMPIGSAGKRHDRSTRRTITLELFSFLMCVLEKGSGPNRAKHPPGRLRLLGPDPFSSWGLTPFPAGYVLVENALAIVRSIGRRCRTAGGGIS